LWFCIVMLLVPVAAQDFFVKQWERSLSTEDQREMINCLDVGDLDGDGIPEIVLGLSIRPEAGIQKYAVQILDHNGKVKQKWDSTYPVNDVSISDVNSDGKSEIIVSGADLYVLSEKAQNLNYPPVGTVVFAAIATDLDGDGKKEFLVGTRDIICRSDTITWSVPIGSQIKKIIVSDIDYDRVPEIIVLTVQNVHVLDVNGTRRWLSPGTQDLKDMAVADIDEDRTEEILFSTDNKLILIWEARENGLEREIDLESRTADFLAVEDLDEDGTPEIIAASSKLKLEVLNLKGTLLWEYKFEIVESQDRFNDMVLSDLDGDRKLDIVLAHSISAFEGDLDSFLYFMKNEAEAIPPERGTEYYQNAVTLFNEGKYADAIDLFIQAQAAFAEEGNQGMADTCQYYIDTCEENLKIEKADSVFSQAETQFEQEAYAEALQLYQEAETRYAELGDSEKVQMCSERISEIESMQAPTEEPPEEPVEEPERKRPLLVLVIIVAVVGGSVLFLVRHFAGRGLRGVAEKAEKTEKVEKADKVGKGEKVEEVEKPGAEKTREEERKLKAQFVYGEINREEYKEKLKELYEGEN
jgi:tetratricopeptide (TPR) repeat protein